MYKLFSTLFYIGFLPRFQASIASLIGFAVYQFLFEFPLPYEYIFILYFTPLSLGIAAVYHYQKSLAKSHDPKEVVLDEFFAAALIPFFFSAHIYLGLTTLFLYRVIDILKPGLIKKIDDIKNWFAIFLDDFVAVLVAILSMKIIQLLISGI